MSPVVSFCTARSPCWSSGMLAGQTCADLVGSPPREGFMLQIIPAASAQENGREWQVDDA